ncbi:hypothetical protein QQP08_007055 [Theobroma cacao]|nr:hypothetical protein QQP08_007055 [Theobroma cacao]
METPNKGTALIRIIPKLLVGCGITRESSFKSNQKCHVRGRVVKRGRVKGEGDLFILESNEDNHRTGVPHVANNGVSQELAVFLVANQQ